ncbi:annexin-B12-like isoform X2 [Lineus longissimus]|uniref:annexin-B12-like isoform X2 n=1 Tax=Lineus longissimus TaxID=88925 RepID=UPI002B4C5CB5
MSYPYGGPGFGQGAPGYPGGGYPAQGAYGSAMPPQSNAGGYPGAAPGYPATGGPGYPAAGGQGYPAPGGPGYPAPAPAPGMPTPGFDAPGGGMPMPGGSPYPASDPYGAPPPQQHMGFGGVAVAATAVSAFHGMPTPESASYSPSPYGAQPPAPAPGYPAAAPPPGPGMPTPSYGGPPAPGGYAPPPSHSPQPPYGSSPVPPPVQTPAYHTPVPQTQRGPSPQPPTSQMSGMSLSGGTSTAATSKAAPPKKLTQGTVTPAKGYSNADVEADAKILRKAMKGLGTDEKAIIDVLAHRTSAERQKIGQMFKTLYGKDLVKDLKSELGGHFEDVVVALMMPPDEYDAYECRRAMKGAGTDENALIEILCTRSNAEVRALKQAFRAVIGRDLEKDLISETSGHFKRLMVSMSNGARSEEPTVNQAKAAQDAKALYEAGEKKWGTDESKFNAVLASQSFQQLRAVFDEYEKISRKTIEQAIKSEMSGDLERGMLTIVKFVRNQPGYFAELLYKSMKGLGTDDKTLIRVIVTRCEVDMVQIKQEFQKQYHKSLESFIKGDCSGHYKRVLIALVGGNPWVK